MIPVFLPTHGEREAQAVAEVLRSGWLGRGPKTEAFETAFARHIGAEREQVLSLTSCTEGLFHAVAALGLGPGDEVALPSISFVGAANAVAASGAKPVFCDVERRSLNPGLAEIEAAVTPRTKAVLLMHYGGVPREIAAIADFCRQREIKLIEDAANSVAATQHGRACGTFGDVGVWSFDAMKTLSTGEGGMIWCRDGEIRQRILLNTTMGLSSFSAIESKKTRNWWEFEVGGFGRRSILGDVAAALGLVQLERLPDFVRRRREVHLFYEEALADLDWLALPPAPPKGAGSGHAFFWIQCAEGLRDALALYLRQRGVYTTFRYEPLHGKPVYRSAAELPETDFAARNTLLLPQHQGLTDQNLETIAALVREFSCRS